jgi:hypothetical protein
MKIIIQYDTSTQYLFVWMPQFDYSADDMFAVDTLTGIPVPVSQDWVRKMLKLSSSIIDLWDGTLQK